MIADGYEMTPRLIGDWGAAFAGHLQHGTPLPIDVDDAVTNMRYIDAAYTTAGMSPR